MLRDISPASAQVPDPGRRQQKPVFKRWYVVRESPDALSFRYGDSVVVLKGGATRRLIPALLPLMDGTRTVDALTSAVTADLAPGVENAVAHLEEMGLVYPAAEGPDDPPAIEAGDGDVPATVGPPGVLAGAEFFTATGTAPSPGVARGRLDEQRVAVAGGGPASSAIIKLLTESGVRQVERIGFDSTPATLRDFTFTIAVPAGAEMPQLPDLNVSALAADTPWMQVLPFDGTLSAVGPIFIPMESCCFNCYVVRRETNDDLPEESKGGYTSSAHRPESPALVTMQAGLAALLASRWLVSADATLPGELYAIEFHPAVSVTRHRVFRVPRCVDCSPLARVASAQAWSAKPESA
jgi:bacteriocin biosynthesis cyclodehydratase domain-containing protein